MVLCEICEKREATQTLQVCDVCHNDTIIDSQVAKIENQEDKNDSIQPGDASDK